MNRDAPDADLRRRWQDFTSSAEPPDWVRKMIEHYWRTGTYRPEDLQRLLGDPIKGVEIGPNISLASLFQAKQLTAS